MTDRKIKNANLFIIKLITPGSKEYMDTVALRYDILRKPLGLSFTDEQLAAENADFHFALYQAYENGNIVPGSKPLACLVMSPMNDGKIKMRQVAVQKEEQGKGLGFRLVEFVEKWAAENGFREILLHARQSAVPFYLRQNYLIIDEPFTEVGIPHRRMVKEI